MFAAFMLLLSWLSVIVMCEALRMPRNLLARIETRNREATMTERPKTREGRLETMKERTRICKCLLGRKQAMMGTDLHGGGVLIDDGSIQ